MKCRVCGYDLDSNKAFCDMCGTRTTAEHAQKESTSPELFFVSDPAPSEHSFAGDPETPDPFFARDSAPKKKPEPPKDIELYWNVHDFTEPRKPKDISIEWPDFDAPPAETPALERTEFPFADAPPAAERAEFPFVDPLSVAERTEFPFVDPLSAADKRPPVELRLEPAAPEQPEAEVPKVPEQHPDAATPRVPEEQPESETPISEERPEAEVPKVPEERLKSEMPPLPELCLDPIVEERAERPVPEPDTERKPTAICTKRPDQEAQHEAHKESRIEEAIQRQEPVVMISRDASEGFIALPDETGADVWQEPLSEPGRQAERFFTFHQKNEEFQNLLDQEHERIQGRKQAETDRIEEYRRAQAGISDGAAFPGAGFGMTLPGAFPVGTSIQAEEIGELERLLSESAPAPEFGRGDTMPIRVEDIQQAILEPKRPAPPTGDDRLAAMAEAREDYLRSLGLEESYTLPRREEPPRTPPVAVVPQTVIAPSAASSPVAEPMPQHTTPVSDPFFEQDAPAHDVSETATEETAAGAVAPAAADVALSETAEQRMDELFAPVEEETFEEPKIRKSKVNTVLEVLLILLLLLILAETAVIGLRHYAPNHPATQTATRIEQSIMVKVLEGKEKALDLFGGALRRFGYVPDIEEPEEEFFDDDLDFAAIVQENNERIGSITISPKLRYDFEAQYQVEGLGDMVIVEDSFVREAMYATLIAYNSKWVDYVNTGEDDTCLEYLAEGSPAYLAALDFDKAGEIEETFELLALGEIRTDGRYYYAFAREQIEVMEGGETHKQNYVWVYQLEDVGGMVKIVDYTPAE